MTMRLLCVGWGLLILGFPGFCPQVAAQPGVVIVDIKALFKAHPLFNQQLEMLRQSAETHQAESIAAQQQLSRKAELLNQYDRQSIEFREAEATLAREGAAMEVELRNKMFNLVKAEAKLHYDTYQQINQIVAEYCQQQELSLVLRHSPIEMSPSNPESVMQGVNSPIIFCRPSRDITDEIRALLQRESQNANSSQPGLSR